ncbi:LytTR family transcriptional regulator DNA-binding domain-containing protein [Sphingobacterium sp. DN00404]|uniref:LytTR family transcriptional regulator DNA-binding domain-containing protein n=1 Tax=Sphingobacterium micropteri TaxID=2763501 RepID=A0ABR7YTW3_9SPHI|nr:LytTR family transcriptional regulator DNA-binding domain-containing protein [Sphingobacterium micropteri]MBD1434797.1 LytTR family transcriptional regulator DNA-binding domain-containing protein [Sphingobacterium micropteri]
MNRILQRFSVLNLPWWSLKIGFYIVYFAFIQITNSGGESVLENVFVNTVMVIVMISIIEVSQYCLALFFFQKRYLEAFLKGSANYITLAIIGYYFLHENDNVVSAQIWNKDIDASWGMFLKNFSKFYLTFVKYAVILTLLRQVLSFVRKNVYKGKRIVSLVDRNNQETGDVPTERPNEFEFFFEGHRTMKFKAGKEAYVIDIATIVYLEVKDEKTTIYRVSGAPLEVKIPLSTFHEWLPEDRFFQIHKSRIIAINYFLFEKIGHVYMNYYEKTPLKLGSQKRYPQYKAWKERNLLQNNKKRFSNGENENL